MLKICTWNVNGVGTRKDEIMEWISTEQPDFLCLQDLKAVPDQVPSDLRMHPDYVSYWHGAEGHSGVSLLVRRDQLTMQPVFSIPSFDSESRAVEVTLGIFVLLCVSPPDGSDDLASKKRFLDQLIDYSDSLVSGQRQLIVCGDLGVAPSDSDVHPDLRDSNGIGQRAEEREQFERLLGTGLTDLARHLHPDDTDLYTQWGTAPEHRQENIGQRTDHILATHALTTTAADFRSAREFGTSEHAPVVADLALFL